jgi:hypothetical protein
MMPLAPAMRPLNNTSIAAAIPMATPPRSEGQGVKCAQSIAMKRDE